MSEDEKPTGLTIFAPAPRPPAEAVASDCDPRTAEVFRALERARGTVTKTEEPGAKAWERAIAVLQNEVHALREGLAKATPLPDEMAQRLASSSRVLERSVVVPSEKLADFERRLEGAMRELRDSAQGQRRQTDLFAAWHAWWKRQVTVWAVVLGLLLFAGTAF